MTHRRHGDSGWPNSRSLGRLPVARSQEQYWQLHRHWKTAPCERRRRNDQAAQRGGPPRGGGRRVPWLGWFRSASWEIRKRRRQGRGPLTARERTAPPLLQARPDPLRGRARGGETPVGTFPAHMVVPGHCWRPDMKLTSGTRERQLKAPFTAPVLRRSRLNRVGPVSDTSALVCESARIPCRQGCTFRARAMRCKWTGHQGCLF